MLQYQALLEIYILEGLIVEIGHGTTFSLKKDINEVAVEYKVMPPDHQRNLRACGECRDFPCQRVEDLRAPGGSSPHRASIFWDADTANKMGYEARAEAQRARRQGPWCGAPFTWYQERCGVCRRGLKEVRGY